MSRDDRHEKGLRLRTTFDGAADLYHAARPDYPAELFDDLVRLAGLEPGSRLLEIGCATGKATLPLLERGFSVVCVELGSHLAEVARRNLAGYPFQIHVAPFEDWRGAAGFDLVYAATAWHWVDPAVRYTRAHELLRPGGHLAFWSATHAFPQGFDPFFTEIQEVYDAIGESHDAGWPPPPPDEVGDERAEIEASGLFTDVRVSRYLWQQRYTADEYIHLLETFSGHLAMDRWKRDHLYREIRERLARRPAGRLLRDWMAVLHVARRR